MKKYEIKEESNTRIDKAICNIDNTLTRVAIQRMIDNGKILVNGKRIKSSYKINIGDIITIEEENIEEADIVPQDIPIDVIYEDEDILIVNKEKGMVVHPGNGNKEGTLVNAIMYRCKDSLSGIGGKIRPGIVHRLDKDTSGLIIVAKNDNAHINVSKQISERAVSKTYIALVRGNIKEESATINMPIGRSTKDRKKMAVTKQGKEAITNFKVIKRYSGFTLIEVKIETGRTHQIRVHMAEIGFPVVGDCIYSNGKNPFAVEGQMLHSSELEFKHPKTNKELKFEAPLPKYFQDVIGKLERTN